LTHATGAERALFDLCINMSLCRTFDAVFTTQRTMNSAVYAVGYVNAFVTGAYL